MKWLRDNEHACLPSHSSYKNQFFLVYLSRESGAWFQAGNLKDARIQGTET